MNEQQQLIKDTLTRLLADHCNAAVVDQSEQGQWAAGLWQQLADTGLTLAGLPVEAGGSGGELGDSLLVLREAARVAAPLPLAEHFMAGLLLSQHGQSVGVAPLTVMSGDFALDDAGTLSGSATGVAFARWCSQAVTIVDTSKGARLCLVDLTQATIDQHANMAGEPRDTVTVNQLLAPENIMETAADTASNLELMGAATRAVMMAGALDAVLEMSVQYSIERVQFGKPISKFQAIQQQLATLAGEVAASQTASHSVVDGFDSLNELDIAIGKARIGEAVSACTDIAHQVHGAMGYTLEHTLNHRTRRLWSWREEYGNERVWQKALGLAFAAGGGNGLWDAVTSRR